jgi:hypothetical protein
MNSADYYRLTMEAKWRRRMFRLMSHPIPAGLTCFGPMSCTPLVEEASWCPWSMASEAASSQVILGR